MAKTQDRIYPPVGPKITLIPPLKLANTGKPKAPSNI